MNFRYLLCGLVLTLLAGCTTLQDVRNDMAMYRADEAFVQGDMANAAREFHNAARPEGASLREGTPEAQYWLGVFYKSGTGVDQDPLAAQDWMQASAANGYAPAQLTLGLWHLSGFAQPRDPTLAADHIRAAAAQDQSEAVYLLARMRAQGLGVTRDPVQAATLFRQAADLGHDVNPELFTPEGVQHWAQAVQATPRIVPKTAPQTRITNEEVQEIQRLLFELGYDPGPVDGLLGKRTAAAIRAFERDSGSPETGQASTELLRSLRLAVHGGG